MAEVWLKLRARLISVHERNAIVLQEGPNPIWVSLAFVERESAELILPASILDDWGREITSLDLYHWVSKNGEQFPRAEIFGVRPNGIPVQRFLREIDLTATLPCYACDNFKEALASMVQVDSVFIINAEIEEAERISPPEHISFPFRSIKAHWWQIPRLEYKEIEAILIQPINLKYDTDSA